MSDLAVSTVECVDHGRDDTVFPLDASVSLVLRPLSITPHEDEFLVGDPAGGEFIAVPKIAVVIIEALRDGHQLSEVAELAREHTGEDVEVVDFAQALIELGFVAEIDGRPVAASCKRRGDGGRVGEWLSGVTQPLFSSRAWLLYALLFACCAAVLGADPRLRPHGTELLFLHNPVASAACLIVIGMSLAAIHEGAHWLAARVEGIPAQITISRRFYFLVLQTDLTGIWTLPRRRRLGPLLAGMALDTVMLAILLAARITAIDGVWHPPSTLARLIMALIALKVAGIVFQFFIFLRTDLYAVLVSWCGCLNLTRVTQLLLTQHIKPLPEHDRDELSQASTRELRIARRYSWAYLAGIAGAAWFFLSFFAPNIVTVARWTVANLERTPPSQPGFWTGLVLGSLALAPAPLTILVFIRERARRIPHASTVAAGRTQRPTA